MRPSTVITAVLASVACVFAQDQIIQVGGNLSDSQNIFMFSPSNIDATAGSVLTFVFNGAPGNHSITQSTFTDPCTPRDGGFDSGWVFVSQAGSEAAMWNLTITNDTVPLWFFCKQLLPAPHCTAGMVGAVNAPASGSNTFDAFMSNAQSFSGDIGQGEGFLVGQGASASAAPGPIPSGDQLFGAPDPTKVFVSGSSSSSATPTDTSGSSGNGALGTLADMNGWVAAMVAAALATLLM